MKVQIFIFMIGSTLETCAYIMVLTSWCVCVVLEYFVLSIILRVFINFICVFQDNELSKEEIMEHHEVFVGSQATNYGDALYKHDEF